VISKTGEVVVMSSREIWYHMKTLTREKEQEIIDNGGQLK